MRQCLDGQIKTAELELRVALDSAKVRSQTPDSVNSAQIAWTSYRRAQCNAEGAEFEGGSLQPVAVLYCWRRMTRARVAELRAMFRDVPP
jgi:uncharacterized protein YecT (DUF1311 family)